MKRPFPFTLVAWSLCLSLTALMLYQLFDERRAIEEQAKSRSLTLVRLVGEHADSVMDATELALEHTLHEITPKLSLLDGSVSPQVIEEILAAAAKRTPAVDHLLYADAHGHLLASSLERTLGGSMGDEAYFRALRDDPSDRTVAATVRGSVSGRWGLLLARPVRAADGSLAGVLAGHVGLEKTFLSLYRDLGLSPGTSVSVWNEQGTLLLRQPFDERQIGSRIELASLDLGRVSELREASLVALSPIDGVERMVAIRRIEHHPLVVSVSQTREEYLAVWQRQLWLTMLSCAMLVLAATALTHLARRRAGAQRRLQQVIDASPVGIICFEQQPDGSVRAFAANDTARQCFGSVPALDAASAIPELQQLGIDQAIAAAARGGERVRHCSIACKIDGRELRLDLQVFGIAPGQAGLLVEDASARHRNEEALHRRIERSEIALEESSLGVRDWTMASGEVTYSSGWQTLLGCGPQELGNTLAEWESRIHPQDLGRCRMELERHLGGLSTTYRSEYRLRRKDGSDLWVVDRGRVVERGENGRPLRFIASTADISALRHLEDSFALWSHVFSHAQEGILITDAQARIVEANDAYCSTTGYPRSRLIGANPSLMKSGKQGQEFYRDLWQQLMQSGNWQGELINRRADGSVFAQRTRISAVRDREGKPSYFIGFTSDITELRESQQQLDYLAHHDALTQLPNRQQITDHIRLAIALAQRNNQLLAVCAVDLDQFRMLNERFGNAEGDRLLVAVARRLERHLQPGDRLGRLGGDEFVLLLTCLTQPEECDTRLQAVQECLRQTFEIGGEQIGITASIGATLHPLDGGDADTLLRHADQALYAAKQLGGNACHLFDTEQDRRLRAHRQAVSEVRAALEAGQLLLHYQPKVRLDNGAVVGAEALLRWQHGERGLIGPLDFIAHIADEPLLTAIGEWTLATAVAQAARWHAAGHSIPLSVNVTAGQILQPDFAERLRRLLASQPALPHGLLEIEILESAALQDLPSVVALMQQCGAMGVSFALDDFGTGYASLTYLKHLPAATLKIDQSFVRDILFDAEHRAIVEGVLGLARVFGRQAIAEGVETLEHGIELLRLGATHAQGYAIASAMPADALPEWIAGWRNPPEWTRASWRFSNSRATPSAAQLKGD